MDRRDQTGRYASSHYEETEWDSDGIDRNGDAIILNICWPV